MPDSYTAGRPPLNLLLADLADAANRGVGKISQETNDRIEAALSSHRVLPHRGKPGKPGGSAPRA
jgi:hypothetical protein